MPAARGSAFRSQHATRWADRHRAVLACSSPAIATCVSLLTRNRHSSHPVLSATGCSLRPSKSPGRRSDRQIVSEAPAPGAQRGTASDVLAPIALVEPDELNGDRTTPPGSARKARRASKAPRPRRRQSKEPARRCLSALARSVNHDLVTPDHAPPQKGVCPRLGRFAACSLR